MAPANAQDNPMRLSIEACKTDDVLLMERVIAIASQPNSCNTVQDVVERSLKRSARRNAVRVLSYLLDRGADVGTLSASDIIPTHDDSVKPSHEVLEILIAHGWDVNTQGPRHTSWPLLWQVVRYPEVVTWCLNHGASVDIPDDPPRVNTDGTYSRTDLPRPPILGMAASSGTVETFELLRSRGAPLDPRTLHLAVERAALHAPRGASDRSAPYTRRMVMVRHLVDVAELDVNAVERQIGN